MKIIIGLLISFVSFSLSATSSMQQKYPHGLLTDDYGILSDADLLVETRGFEIPPYDIKNSMLPFRRWQCFETSKVEFRYSTWRDNDPSGPSNIIVTLCDFHFQVTDMSGIKQIYYGRRTRQVEGCKMYFNEWKKVRKDAKHVCFIGEAGSYENGEKWWVWGKTKTKNKCMNYFEGECDSDKRLKKRKNEETR